MCCAAKCLRDAFITCFQFSIIKFNYIMHSHSDEQFNHKNMGEKEYGRDLNSTVLVNIFQKTNANSA